MEFNNFPLLLYWQQFQPLGFGLVVIVLAGHQVCSWSHLGYGFNQGMGGIAYSNVVDTAHCKSFTVGLVSDNDQKSSLQ